MPTCSNVLRFPKGRGTSPTPVHGGKGRDLSKRSLPSKPNTRTCPCRSQGRPTAVERGAYEAIDAARACLARNHDAEYRRRVLTRLLLKLYGLRVCPHCALLIVITIWAPTLQEKPYIRVWLQRLAGVYGPGAGFSEEAVDAVWHLARVTPAGAAKWCDAYSPTPHLGHISLHLLRLSVELVRQRGRRESWIRSRPMLEGGVRVD